MATTIDYYFSPQSPYSYLGHDRLLAVARRAGADIAYRPVDLAKVLAASGGLPVARRAPSRQSYRMADIARLADHLGLPLTADPPGFPTAEAPSIALIVAIEQSGRDPEPVTMALMRAVWVHNQDIGDPGKVAGIAQDMGIPCDILERAADSEEVADRCEAFTQEAIDRQVFGAPTYVLGGERFWGQDRLSILATRLGIRAE